MICAENNNVYISSVYSYFSQEVPEIALRSLFNKYDTDGNGYLDKDELYTLLEDDLGLTQEQCELYHHLLDKNGDGLVSYEEFSVWFHSGENFKAITDKTRYYYLHTAIVMFKKYDEDNNLAIDEKEFHKLYIDLGQLMNLEEHEAMSQIDVDRNGRISFQEFLKWLNWVPI